MVKVLLDENAIVSTSDKSGNTALSLATKNNHFKVVELIKRGKVSKNISASEEKVKKKKVEFYCEVCSKTFNCSKEEHKASVGHQLNFGPTQVETIYGISEANRGFQMMLGKGWNKEKGLGAEGQGKKFPVKTVLKRDRRGIGSEGANVARVTHFEAFDAKAVDKPKPEPGQRIERDATLSKRKQQELKRKSARQEMRLRRELGGL